MPESGEVVALRERLAIAEANFTERISELEFELEAQGWQRLGGMSEREFSREGLREIAKQARLYFLKNPLIRRGVLTITNYCFGSGITVEGATETTDAIIQGFLVDEGNQAELTTPEAMSARDHDVALEGNLFFCFFTNAQGDVRVRTILFDEIEDVICNPEDAKEPWFYVRKTVPTSMTGAVAGGVKTQLYPDWRYRPAQRPASYLVGSDQVKVEWETPVYHVAVNRLNGQRFGTPETYSAHDWAQAYNKFLSDWATLVRSLSKFAWKLTTKGGQAARTAAKAKLDSGLTTGADSVTPAPSAGSVFVNTADSADIVPIPKTGATVSAEDGRRLLLMVASAMGLPETFFGDVSTGNLATAKTLDRPTELLCMTRQRLWAGIIENVLRYVLEAKARAGTVPGFGGHDEPDAWGELAFVFDDDPETGEPLDTHVSVTFPSLVERDTKAAVEAIVQAATLGGVPAAGTLGPEWVSRQLLIALGEKSVEEEIADLYPEGEELPETVRADVGKLREAIREFLVLVKEGKSA